MLHSVQNIVQLHTVEGQEATGGMLRLSVRLLMPTRYWQNGGAVVAMLYHLNHPFCRASAASLQ